ncbi:Putative cell surface protein precursor SprD [Tenacibaculum sp. 190130A14a]|uniref:Type IX secretion system PorP/SprF family membrane protein n=1 Tax=Tenacibaculum polynesiense TaxID=3137857 RepID=A0ABM9P6M8_9FLAO
MVKKYAIYTVLFSVLSGALLQAQTSGSGQEYNTFNSRSFMKFNRFLTVPTFSALRENKTSLTAIVRNGNIEFEDNPRVYIGAYSGKMRENVGAGIAVYQQEVGVFKDFGAIANYAHRLRLNETMDLTFGFNLLYSRRSADGLKVNSTVPDPQVANFQDVPVVMFQPAVTVSFGRFDVGVFFENLLDFNLKSSELATDFGEKTISAHAMYSHEFTYATGLMEGADLRFLGIARKPGEGDFGYAGNVIFDLPKAGWVKVGYDKDFGVSAGVGVNISDQLAIGFSYEKSDFASTNEVGIIYNFGKKTIKRRRIPTRRTGKVNVSLPERTNPQPKNEYNNPEHNDLSDEIQRAQDSIDILNKKVDEILKLLKNQPQNTTTIIQQPAEQAANKDTSLKRRSDKPWRKSYVERAGGGGTMYYIVLDQFRNKDNADALINKFKSRNKDSDIVKYVFEPKKKIYYVYVDRFAKEEDADEMLEDFNDSTRQFENEDEDDVVIKVKKEVKDPVYKVKITLGGESGSYREQKSQPPARVRTLSKSDGIAPGYYLQVYVNGLKSYADRNVDELRSDGIDAGYFINPATGYYHTYIFKTDSREEAIRMYNNNLDGSFYDRKSIIHIK